MGTPVEPKPAKYFVACSDFRARAACRVSKQSFWRNRWARSMRGAKRSPWHESKYYEKEMGARLWRCFWSVAVAAQRRQTRRRQTADPGDRRYDSAIRFPAAAGSISIPGYLDTLQSRSRLDQKRQPAHLSQLRHLRRSDPVLSPWRLSWLAVHLSGLSVACRRPSF